MATTGPGGDQVRVVRIPLLPNPFIKTVLWFLSLLFAGVGWLVIMVQGFQSSTRPWLYVGVRVLALLLGITVSAVAEKLEAGSEGAPGRGTAPVVAVLRASFAIAVVVGLVGAFTRDWPVTPEIAYAVGGLMYVYRSWFIFRNDEGALIWGDGLWRFLTDVAFFLRQEGRRNEALFISRLYVRLHPGDPYGWINLLSTYVTYDEDARALEIAQEGYRRHPYDPRLAYHLVYLLASSDESAAERVVDEMQSRFPNSPWPSIGRARLAALRAHWKLLKASVDEGLSLLTPTPADDAAGTLAAYVKAIPGGRAKALELLKRPGANPDNPFLYLEQAALIPPGPDRDALVIQARKVWRGDDASFDLAATDLFRREEDLAAWVADRDAEFGPNRF